MDGVEFTGTGFCVGDNLTFTCTVSSLGHQWRGPSLSLTINPGSIVPYMDGPDGRFILTRVGSQRSRIITSLSLIVYFGFDGATLTCADSLLVVEETQTSTASVLGEVYTYSMSCMSTLNVIVV